MRLFQTMFLITIFTITSLAKISTVEQIAYRDLFRPIVDSTAAKNINAIVLLKADSIKTSIGKGHLVDDENFKSMLNFRDLNCLNLVMLTYSLFIFGDPIASYQVVLFNACDSSIYMWEGGIDNYSNVIKYYLDDPAKEDSSFILGLIELYLNTTYFYDPAIIIATFADFERTFSDKRLLLPWNGWSVYTIKDAKADKKKVKRALKDMQYTCQNDTCSIELCSWGLQSGQLEYWHFLITPGKMEILKHEILLEDVGPFRLRLGSD